MLEMNPRLEQLLAITKNTSIRLGLEDEKQQPIHQIIPRVTPGRQVAASDALRIALNNFAGEYSYMWMPKDSPAQMTGDKRSVKVMLNVKLAGDLPELLREIPKLRAALGDIGQPEQGRAESLEQLLIGAGIPSKNYMLNTSRGEDAPVVNLITPFPPGNKSAAKKLQTSILALYPEREILLSGDGTMVKIPAQGNDDVVDALERTQQTMLVQENVMQRQALMAQEQEEIQGALGESRVFLPHFSLPPGKQNQPQNQANIPENAHAQKKKNSPDGHR